MLQDMTAVPPTWAILIPTLGERRRLFDRLICSLLPQTEPYDGRVQVIGAYNNGAPGLPKIRHLMMSEADRRRTDYLSFVDDDDMVPPYFVEEIMTALDQRPDYVGFHVQCYSDDTPTAVSYHSLENTKWENLPDRYLRDISHINPMRTSIARSADFRRAAPGQAEDRAWVHQLRQGRKLKEQVMIDRIMYHYLFSTSKTAGIGSRWKAPGKIHPGTERTLVEHPNFSWLELA